jgi:hypothetical protein
LAAGLTALAGAINQTDLGTAVDTTPDVTIFAPNNDAFSSIGSALQSLNNEDLTEILQYHVVAGTIGYSSELENGTTLETLQGTSVTIRKEGNAIFVNNARVIQSNVLVANGVVHVIDEYVPYCFPILVSVIPFILYCVANPQSSQGSSTRTYPLPHPRLAPLRVPQPSLVHRGCRTCHLPAASRRRRQLSRVLAARLQFRLQPPRPPGPHLSQWPLVQWRWRHSLVLELCCLDIEIKWVFE